MQYLIDGYNFVFRLGLKRKFSLQAQREEFIKTFAAHVEKLRLHVALVFDGKDMPKGSFTRGNWRDIDIVYTHYGLSADDYILEQVESSKRPRSITVVTSDRGLGAKASMYGSRVMSIEEFMSYLLKKTKPKEKEKPAFREAGFHFQRLLRIFEERLKEGE